MSGVRFARLPVSLALLTLLPSIASAQSTIAGVVKDTSGAVLPGVTVEASSPVLIERARSAATDGDGRYSIVALRPGVYEIAFTLAGFSTFKRDGVDRAGGYDRAGQRPSCASARSRKRSPCPANRRSWTCRTRHASRS